MGKKSTPTPPDPVLTAQAQTQSSKDTASYNQQLNMINASGPYGSVTYSPDASAPGGYRQTTALSEDQQKLFDASMQTQIGAVGVAGDQIGRVSEALKNPIDPASFGKLATGVQAGPMAGPVSAPALRGEFDTGQPIQGRLRQTPVRTGYGGGGAIQDGFDAGGRVAGGFDPGQAVQGHVGDAGEIAGGYDRGGEIAYGYDRGGDVAYGYDAGGPIQRQVQGQGSAPWAVQSAQNAVYGQAASRLDPQWSRAEESQRAQLAAQGLSQTSDAWRSEMQTFNDARNDAYNQAIFSAVGAGAAEQNTLFGQDLARGQFVNQAQAQANTQNLGAAGFQNAAQAQANAENERAAGFHNAAQGQANTQNQQAAVFANSAQAQRYGQTLSSLQAENQAAAQQYAQNQGLAAFANQAQAQQYGENQGLAAFGNQAQAQREGQNAARAQFYNQATGQQFDRGLAAGQFANQAQQQSYAQNLGAASFQNDAANARFQNQLSAAQLQNLQQQQGWQQQYANAQLNNAAQSQAFNQGTYAQTLPINELSALLGLGQVQSPTGIGYTPSQAAGTDVAGIYQNNFSNQMAAYNARAQSSNALMSGLFSLGSAAIMHSDARLKQDVRRVGELDNGLAVYSFRYRGQPTTHIGVMAQEALKVAPHAVHRDAHGFLLVDYGALA